MVRVVFAGLAKYFPHLTAVVINSDGGSKDNTREAALSARVEDKHLMLLSTPFHIAHRLSFPYHGVPGKGSTFRLVFQMADRLGAKACALVDSDLRSITPEWIDLLLRPILGRASISWHPTTSGTSTTEQSPTASSTH
jgi:glycosyltransferase involved in cell wall biosynthesis